MSVIDSAIQTGSSVKSADASTTARPTFRRPRIVLPVPTPALKFQKAQPGVPDTVHGGTRTGAPKVIADFAKYVIGKG